MFHSPTLDGIRARIAKATEGPWEASWEEDAHIIRMASCLENPGNFDCAHEIRYEHGCYEDEDDDGAQEQAEEANANAAFIAHSREDVPYLLSVIDRMAEALAIAKARMRDPQGIDWQDAADQIAELLACYERGEIGR